MGQKYGFLNFLKKILFLRYGSKCSQPIRWQDFLINHISPEQINEIVRFLHIDTNSSKLKVDQKCLGWVWSEMGVASLSMGL